jgi:hypothetical protein
MKIRKLKLLLLLAWVLNANILPAQPPEKLVKAVVSPSSANVSKPLLWW